MKDEEKNEKWGKLSTVYIFILKYRKSRINYLISPYNLYIKNGLSTNYQYNMINKTCYLCFYML